MPRVGGPGSGESGPIVPRTPAPPLPDEATLSVLHPSVREAVHGLGASMAAVVGRHLAAAGLLVDEDPELALLHASAAKSRAPRLAEVREAVGIAAYAAGQFSLARSELRAARRMTGAPELLPLLADCERALGQPERALEIAADPSAARLTADEQVELAIVVSGARRDLGEPEAALQALERPELRGPVRDAAGLRLRYAYAEALIAAGRSDEAVDWFTQVATADDEGDTDAWERLHALRG
ncbi:MAG TPA: tetratricopeptide repeat protein [Mycobacteriales bacterium]|nr:tetratricopeptide repeat protein [Mycobacteriales bacterium]